MPVVVVTSVQCSREGVAFAGVIAADVPPLAPVASPRVVASGGELESEQATTTTRLAIHARFARATHRRCGTEQVIAAHLDRLFPGMDVAETFAFRVTRNFDIASLTHTLALTIVTRLGDREAEERPLDFAPMN